MNNRTKIYKIYSLVIKTAIIVVAFWYIYNRLFVKDNLHDNALLTFNTLFSKPSFQEISLLVILLMAVNWGIETYKWKYLIGKIENVPFAKALVAVLSGITVSVFTPNRVGEYAGRVFVLEKASRWEGVFVTIVGSLSQLLVTLLAGSVSFIFFVDRYIDFSDNPGYYFYALVFIIIILIVLLIFMFFNVSFLTGIINRLPWKLKKIKQYGNVFSLYSGKELLIVLLLSTARYLVFVTQFYLVLTAFGVCIPYCQAFILVSMIYLVMAAIPINALVELGIRVSASLYFIGIYYTSLHYPADVYKLEITTASSVLWLINLAFPALLGAVFIFRLKFFRKN